jgi:hypothetical protein
MKALKIAGAALILVWGLYLTWEVHRAHELAGQACGYAAMLLNNLPGPGLDSQHRDVKWTCG